MSNHENSQTLYDSALLNQIASQTCQAIITIHNQQPELLIEKYRKIKWQKLSNQTALINKFIQLLKPSHNWEELLKKLQLSLQAILIPEALNLPIFRELITEIKHQNPEDIEIAEINNGLQPKIVSSLFPLRIAVLLLDAENLQLNNNTEKFLATLCKYPIQVKIAFANWNSRGKLDIELHERGYDLIHVPAGRDNADGKMIAFGASIHELYPHAQAVFVCSSDKVMTNLCNNLQQHGLIVYQVSQHGDNINIFNNSTGETIIHSIKPLPEIPSLDQFIVQVKQIIKEQQNLTQTYWIPIEQISQLYKNKYQLNINNVVSQLLPDQKFKDILINYPADFVIHQIDNAGEVYTTLFESNQIPNTNHKSSNSKQQSIQSNSKTDINSTADLQQALNQILLELLQKTNHESFDISILASQFKQRYGIPITQQIKDLQIAGTFVRFLQSCDDFHIHLKDKKWEVSKFDISHQTPIAISGITTIKTISDLEQALRTIILDLTENTQNSPVDVSILGVKFHQKYSKPITKQMKELKITGSFIKFLQSCNSFQIQQKGNKYKVLVIGDW
jgi:hypothetical protein